MTALVGPPFDRTSSGRKDSVGLESVSGESRNGAHQLAEPVINWQRHYVRDAVLLDAAMGLAGASLALLRFETTGLYAPYPLLTAGLPLIWVLSLALGRAYELRLLFAGNDEYRRVANAAVWLVAAVLLFSYAVNFQLARGYALIAFSIIPIATLIGRYLLRKRLHRARARGECMYPVLIMGHERAVAELCRQLQRQPHHGMKVVGALLSAERMHPGALADVGVPVVGSFEDAPAAVAQTGANTVAVLACPELDSKALRHLAWELEKTDTDLIVAPALMDAAGPRTTIRPIDGLPMLHVEHAELTGARRLIKDAIDRVLAATVLIVAAPAMLAIFVVITSTSPGPALFRQVRVGRDGQHFVLYKFRTMHHDAEQGLARLLVDNPPDGVLFKMAQDPRMTKVGRFLRRYSLDELPQLVNVLTGRMSLVGPRPPLPSEVEQYRQDAHRRFKVKPGMTGLWQISGRSNLSWEDSVRLDLRYVENWSLSSDLVIMLRTISAVLRSSGAY